MASNEIMVNQVNIENKQLAKYTEQLFNIGLNVRKSYLKVANIIHQIDEKGLAIEQFGNLTEYGEQVLGLKKAQIYALKNVGERFVNSKTKQSTLYHEDKDFSVTQLQALLPVKDDEVLYDWSEKKVINPDMTVSEIKQVVKDYKNPKSESETNEETDEITADVKESDETFNFKDADVVFSIEVWCDGDGYEFMQGWQENGTTKYEKIDFDSAVKLLKEYNLNK